MKFLPTQWHFEKSYVRRHQWPIFGKGATPWTVMGIFMAEFFGTGILMYLGCMSILIGLSHFEICFAFGIVVMICLQSLGPISVGHINPSISVAAVMLGLITWPMCAVYVLAQITGAILGYALLLVVTPYQMRVNTITNIERTCCTVQHPALNDLQAVASEFCATAILIFLLCACWDRRNATRHDSLVLKFGFAISALALAAGPFTGGSMNSARSLGPALWHNVWERHWIYWVGPLSAAVIVPIFYRLFFDNDLPPIETTTPTVVVAPKDA